MKPKEMSRGAQTAWIVAAIFATGLAFMYFNSRVDQERWDAECQTIMGKMDHQCVRDLRHRLMHD